MAYPPIEDHGAVGDRHTIALVGKDGCINYMCFPEFDSPSIFARLLDAHKGGHFKVAPTDEDGQRRQVYLPDTNVLLTRFLANEGVAEVSDYMPVEEVGPVHNLVRRAKTIRGSFRFHMECKPAFDYGRTTHRLEIRSNEAIFTPDSSDAPALRLRSEVPLEAHEGAAIADFTLHDGESAAFILETADSGDASPTSAEHYVANTFKATVNFWQTWAAQSTYQGRWREMVKRSALTLKLLTSAEHGSIVAAPTFGLPEEIGGVRNWDYRYTWVRDASFTLYALIRLGYTEEAAQFMSWIEDRTHDLNSDGSLQIMYGIDGRKQLKEIHLDHLEGYRGSRPVRIGNAAFDQLQLDIYGELMDSVYLYDKYGAMISHGLWSNLVRLIDWIGANWRQPDEGIWEVRGGKQEFLFSRLMSWVAVDRGVRLARRRSLPAPIERWKSTRDEIYEDIHSRYWEPSERAFVQYRGSRTVDASSLLMPLVRFISPTDPRWLSHLEAIERHLVHDSLVYRYNLMDSQDGLSGSEGTFSMCSFWYVECLSRSGDLQKARFYFEKMLGYANHLGLYAEELGPTAEHLGNFPQAFTHLALISAAYDLNRRLDANPRAL
jgi:GH15 family glucan-1,4-alpha-glucosidase